MAPAMATIPPKIHKSNTQEGLGKFPAIKPEVVKIPAPIIFAITMLVAVSHPICLPIVERLLRDIEKIFKTAEH